MEELKKILETKLDVDNPTMIASQLAECESWSGLVATKHRNACLELSQMRGKCFNPSLSSEDKRKIDLEYQVREYQHTVDVWSDFSDIIKRRISLGQTLLKVATTEMQSGLR